MIAGNQRINEESYWVDALLLEVWQRYGREQEPDVFLADWGDRFKDILRFTCANDLSNLCLADGTRLDRILTVVPAKDSSTVVLTHDDVPWIASLDEHGEELQQETPSTYTFSFTPEGVKKLQALELEWAPKGKPGRKTNARQITIDGREIDLRNRANFDFLNARLEDVENVTESYLHQLRNRPTKNQRRACICQLHRVVLLRGPQLRRDLFGSVCLRLGAPLPADFWHVPNVGKTRSTPSFPLDTEENR